MISAEGCDTRRMGNILETDSSTESDISEVRTAGDGMERPPELDHLRRDKYTSGLKPPVISPPSKPTASLTGGPVLLCHKKPRTSPKSLPPSKDLILLKPIRIGEGARPSEATSDQSNGDFVAQSSSKLPMRKQREPKFVPYEPYAGAVRPIVTSSSDDQERRQSSSASSSILAVSDDLSVPSGVQTKRSSDSSRPPVESSNTTLLKERLRISEKDIEELQIENTRLKRLLVDTLSGSPAPTTIDPQQAKTNRMLESVESLSNEIKVWRSKFLASCVLVEQLTKEKEDMVRVTTSAAELFKEIKARVDLTPDLYESLRDWISAEDKERTIRKESSFGSLLDDDF